MLQAIKQFFSEHVQLPTDEIVSNEQAINLAAAALLVEVGRADFDFSEQEQIRISHLLQETLSLDEKSVTTLVDLATQASTDATSLHGFTQLIHQHYTPGQKQQLMVQLWSVALADGQLDKYEEYYLRKIADLLYLSHQDFIQAKLQVTGEEDTSGSKRPD